MDRCQHAADHGSPRRVRLPHRDRRHRLSHQMRRPTNGWACLSG
jgi:hypothetical protein